MGSTDAHASIQPICLLMLQLVYRPVVENVLPRVLGVHLSLPRWLE